MDDGRPIAKLPQRFEDWFAARGWRPRPHQLELAEAAAQGSSALLIAPTGGGKTLAGFLPSLIELADVSASRSRRHALHTLYISPLKALTADVARNLEIPAREMGLNIRIETRTGDTPPAKRTRQRAFPPDILLTTPEQVMLLMASEHPRVFFEDLRAIIIDEIHAVAPTKRGDLLALALARIGAWAPAARRIGLSATVADPDALASWLGGVQKEAPPPPLRGRAGRGGVQKSARRQPTTSAPHPLPPPRKGEGDALIRMQIIRGAGGAAAHVEVLESEALVPWAGHTGRHAMREVYEAIRRAKIALVFVNTRAQAELTFQELWRVNDDGLPIALHHGSLDVAQRRKVETAMAAGALRAVVCTSTLDLGIDWGEVDLVIQMGAPKGCSRLVQRIGRANHRLDEPSNALLVPNNRFEVLECRAAKDAVAEGALDGEVARVGGLDCLAQHIMGASCGEPFEADALYAEAISTAPYAALTRETFDRALATVATGGYALRSYDRYRRIVQDPNTNLWRARGKQAAQQHRMNVGAIVEADYLDVRLVSPRTMGLRRAAAIAARKGENTAVISRANALGGGRRLGKIEEWLIESMSPGDTFLFAGEIVRFEAVMETEALVTRAPDAREPKIPSYAGGKFPLSTYLAERVRKMLHDRKSWKHLPEQVREWLTLQAQRSIIPKHDELLVETFPRANKFYLVCYPFEGRLAQQTLGMLLTRRLERMGKKPLGFVASEYAMSVWGFEPLTDVDMDKLFDEDMLGDDLDAWLAEAALMKRTFRTCAIIAGMIEKRAPGSEKSGRQITFSTDLIYDVLRQHEPDHLLLQAAFADAGEGFLDIRRLASLLKRVKGRIVHRDLDRTSPLAVPVMMEIGKELVGAAGEEQVLKDASEALLAEALG
ncbi:MAG: ligase-associated DNA damage response DEXH box helicase [Hyphomonadaceae bacterium]|nr:ligase-associated DNA damage response DEXH box helicase [Hyphomonadaceae bacterium]